MTLLRGILWILFGIVVLAQPGLSLVTFALTFGAVAFVDGIGHVVSAVGGRNEYGNWWVLLLSGLAGIAVGVLTFLSPGATALGLLYGGVLVILALKARAFFNRVVTAKG
jgi:uncharacterized membrane protein HdeD (DUF308 family)